MGRGGGSREGKQRGKSHVPRNVRLCCGRAVGSSWPSARKQRTSSVNLRIEKNRPCVRAGYVAYKRAAKQP